MQDGEGEWRALAILDWKVLTDKLTCEKRSEGSVRIWGKEFQKEGTIRAKTSRQECALQVPGAIQKPVWLGVGSKGQRCSHVFRQSRNWW